MSQRSRDEYREDRRVRRKAYDDRLRQPDGAVPEDPHCKVFLKRTGPVVHAPMPAGYEIRPIDPDREVEAYVEMQRHVFGSENMTVGWRARTMAQPNRLKAADLLAIDLEGKPVGFYVCWRLGREGQVEPMGVNEDSRSKGLGAALLTRALHALAAEGIETVYVETDDYRDAAKGLYGSVGFKKIRDVKVYRKDY